MDKVMMMEIDSADPDSPVVEIVHYDGVPGFGGGDYTLCGVSHDEDSRYPDESFTPTNKRVTCEKCKRIRNYVLGFKPKDSK